jgi:hypothetical protein
MPEMKLPKEFDPIIARLVRGEPVDPDDLVKLAAAMHTAGLSFTGASVPRFVASLPPDAKQKLVDAEAHASWSRVIERYNARIRS